MIRKEIILVLSLMGMMLSMSAQDIHFSQFYNSPLTLNPALTGKIDGKFRIAVNYRNQWYNVIETHSPYVTYAGSFDMPIKFKSGDALGVGLQVFKDDQGDGAYENLTFMASVAYHKILDKKENHTLSVGVQAGYIQKKIGAKSFLFADQFGGNSGTVKISETSAEAFADDAQGSADVQVGALYVGKLSEKTMLYIGGSLFNTLSHEASFLKDESYKVPRRYVGHAGLEVLFGKRVALIPSVIYMSQASTNEINAGVALGYYFNNQRTTGMYIGGYYRVSDAPIAYAAIEISGFKIGASYDFTTSDVQDAPNYNGSYELSLVYVFKPSQLPEPGSLLYNPRF